ncbi:MAG: DNA repair protein RecN [Eubacteriales bacterium]|nr:DNA repair protein RecN [Eubacteriales bacterium]
MLLELTIRNFALISDLEVRLEEGLTIISGETGAGKSIFLDALAFIGGQRASRDLVRKPAERAQVYALFTEVISLLPADLLDRLALSPEELQSQELLVYREIDSKGRSIAKVNGRPLTISLLRDLGTYLFNLHAQNEQISLFDPQKQAEILDSYGPETLWELKGQWADMRQERIQKLKALQELGLNPQERERKLDLLSYQIQELAGAFMSREELDTLQAAFQELNELDKIRSYTAEGLQLLDPDQEYSALNFLNRSLASLQKAERYSPRLSKLLGGMQVLADDLQAYSRQLKTYLLDLAGQAESREELRARMEAWERLEQKYGPGWDQVAAFYEQAQADYDFTKNSESNFRQLRADLQEGQDQAAALAQKMHEIRLEAGLRLSQEIKAVLGELNMSGVDFQVEVQMAEAAAPHYWAPGGRDRIEFLISTNYGEGLMPLAKIASGGEASRILLALKSILAKLDNIPLLIFDEIDTGISGQTAHLLGEKLRALGGQHQVIAVTHTAQIAAMADQHLHIYKEVQGDRTVTRLAKLDLAGRRAELARLLAGSSQDEKALALASTLMQPYNRDN